LGLSHLDDCIIYNIPLYKIIVTDKTIVILSNNLAILTIKGALVLNQFQSIINAHFKISLPTVSLSFHKSISHC